MRSGSNGDLGALMRAANAGDGVAYREVLTALSGLLRAQVRRGLARVGRSGDEAEDIVQEALLAVHLKRQTWDESQPLEPWARAIAHYKLVDHLRRRGTAPHVDLDDVAEIAAVETVDHAATLDRERLIGQLPERQRRVVEAVSLEGQSAAEVGRAMNMSEGAVRVTLHRALKAMAAFAKRDEP